VENSTDCEGQNCIEQDIILAENPRGAEAELANAPLGFFLTQSATAKSTTLEA
jgi:hypothetical protein